MIIWIRSAPVQNHGGHWWFRPIFHQKTFSGALRKDYYSRKTGVRKKNLKFFSSIFIGSPLSKLKKIPKIFGNFFFEPRFFGHKKPFWGPLKGFLGEIWVETTSDLYDFGPEPIWSKLSLTIRGLCNFLEFLSTFGLFNLKQPFSIRNCIRFFKLSHVSTVYSSYTWTKCTKWWKYVWKCQFYSHCKHAGHSELENNHTYKVGGLFYWARESKVKVFGRKKNKMKSELPNGKKQWFWNWKMCTGTIQFETIKFEQKDTGKRAKITTL